ncbi:hypothetical protein COCCADRAFT_98975, partial [Bipolaris zeicola 26-R-13]
PTALLPSATGPEPPARSHWLSSLCTTTGRTAGRWRTPGQSAQLGRRRPASPPGTPPSPAAGRPRRQTLERGWRACAVLSPVQPPLTALSVLARPSACHRLEALAVAVALPRLPLDLASPRRTALYRTAPRHAKQSDQTSLT